MDFSSLLDLDFSPGGWGGDIDWDAIIGALGEMDLSGGELWVDPDTGEVVDAATAAVANAAEDYNPDLDLSGSGSGPVMDDPFSGSLGSSPLSRSTSDMLRSLDAEGQEGDLWREQMDPFTGLTAQMPEGGFDWMKLLRAAGSGLSGLLGGGGDNPLAGLLGGGRPLSMPGGLGDTALGGVPSVGGGMSAPAVGAPGMMSVADAGRSLPTGGGGMYGEASVPGMAGTPSSYVRDPITGAIVPAPAQTPPASVQPLALSPFSPLIIPSPSGQQIPMMQPVQRMSGLQRLIREFSG